jgi:hypothetical protein
VATFQELFSGSDRTHGHWTQESGYFTHKGPAPDQDYSDHLTGTMGLGLVPVRVDGTCVFGALDIDIDTIDHQALYAKVAARNLPLNVCRSKSGAAHCYVFFKQPYKAAVVQTLLRKWAGLLGYPNCEVFPKQTKIDDDKNLGNWINLPYFGGDNSLRYCVGPKGSLGLTEFLNSTKMYDPNDKYDESGVEVDGELVQLMPPCLHKLVESGLPEGVRNQGMFNFAVFYRKAYPNGWEEKLKEHNDKYCTPKLEHKEIQTLIKSVRGKKYQYTCSQEPVCSRCNRPQCLQMRFGVSHMPWQEGGSFDDFTVSKLRKIDTKPPRYRLEVNGTDIEMSTDDLRNYQVGFKKVCFEHLNLILPPSKQEFWDVKLRELMETIEIIEAPPDASLNGMVMLKVLEFTALSERAKKLEDVLKGIPFRNKDLVVFRSIDLQKYLQSARFAIEAQVLYQLLLSEGGSHQSLNIKGKSVMVWRLPVVAGSMQTEAFDEVEHEKISEEL